MSSDQYNSLLKKNTTKSYRKTTFITQTRTDKETRKFSKLSKLDNKMSKNVFKISPIKIKAYLGKMLFQNFILQFMLTF